MRTSRGWGWGLAVCVLLGLSGCAGVRQQRVMVPSMTDASASAAPAPTGLRGWWARRVGRGAAYQTTTQAAPANAWPGSSGGGWPSIFEFSRPPWVTRQPTRAPIFSRNDGVPAQPRMTPAEVNEAIARMTRDRKEDDRVLPVRGVDPPLERARTRAGDGDRPSVLSQPIRLPDSLSASAEEMEPRAAESQAVEEPQPRVAEEGPSLIRGSREADRAAVSEPAPEAATDGSPERVATTSPAKDRAETADGDVVLSSQLPPPPPIRPVPGSDAPAPVKPSPAPAVEQPAKPAETPARPVAQPAETPANPAEPAPVAPQPAPPAPEPPKTEAPTPKPEEPAPAAPEPQARPISSVLPQPPPPSVQAPSAVQVPQAVATAAAEPSRARRWAFWNWKSSHGGAAYASPQDLPAQLPPPLFPTSYESVWAKPLSPCPDHARVPLASPQAVPTASPQAQAAAEKAPCWLVERLKGRMHQVKIWKHEHICRHIQNFKAALKGDCCQACKAKAVTPSPQAAPSPQAPRVQPSLQEPPLIGGSRFGMY